MDLVAKSLAVLRDGQHASGAFVGSPTYAPYRKAWLRDGAFNTMALDRFGDHGRAAAFHSWVARVVLSERAALAAPSREEGHYVRARYPLDDPDVPAGEDAWANFQLDGPALWLIALEDHLVRTRGDLAPYREAAVAVGRYLEALGDGPCFDPWEEHGGDVHGATLAAITGGLHALVSLGRDEFSHGVEVARARLFSLGSDGTTLLKFRGATEVDSALLWSTVPCEAVRPEDPRMHQTVARIRAELHDGRTRYRGDAYFGGGQWPLLAGLDGWHAVADGDPTRAAEQLAWIEARAEPDGSLPEQVAEDLERPEERERWLRQFGPPASPLLWSHAMYLILRHALAEGVG